MFDSLKYPRPITTHCAIPPRRCGGTNARATAFRLLCSTGLSYPPSEWSGELDSNQRHGDYRSISYYHHPHRLGGIANRENGRERKAAFKPRSLQQEVTVSLSLPSSLCRLGTSERRGLSFRVKYRRPFTTGDGLSIAHRIAYCNNYFQKNAMRGTVRSQSQMASGEGIGPSSTVLETAALPLS